MHVYPHQVCHYAGLCEWQVYDEMCGEMVCTCVYTVVGNIRLLFRYRGMIILECDHCKKTLLRVYTDEKMDDMGNKQRFTNGIIDGATIIFCTCANSLWSVA